MSDDPRIAITKMVGPSITGEIADDLLYPIVGHDVAAGRLPEAATGVDWGCWPECVECMEATPERYANDQTGIVLYGELVCSLCGETITPSSEDIRREEQARATELHWHQEGRP